MQLLVKQSRRLLSCLLVVGILMPGHMLMAQVTQQVVTVSSPSLEGNLLGFESDREVFVYLPDGYNENSDKRYPVVYFLHGFRASAQMYVDFLGLPGLADEAFASGVRDMIVVLPNSLTPYGGSFYSSSPAVGDWEGFIAKDLVNYIDANYRTIASREGRGLSGHSMGGYGTLRIGMKYPDVFNALFIMSAGALLENPPPAEVVAQRRAALERGTEEEITTSVETLSAAWAPNPQNPHYMDWPYDEDGNADQMVMNKWMANSGLVMVDQYVPALKSFSAIYVDVGDQDGLARNNLRLSEAFFRLNVPHIFELYEGTHGNRVVARFRDDVLPFFDLHLAE